MTCTDIRKIDAMLAEASRILRDAGKLCTDGPDEESKVRDARVRIGHADSALAHAHGLVGLLLAAAERQART